MFNLVKWQKKMSITMCIILLIVSVSGFYADDGEFFIPSSNVIDLTERNEVQLNGYAYSPKSEDDFKFFGDVVLNIDLVSKKGEIISEIGVFQLDFNLEKFENGRIDYFGKAISDQEKFELLISVLNDKGMKVYGLIDGAFAFNAGTTIGYSDFREKARLSTQSLLQDNTDIIVRSSDPYVVDDGTKNSVYAQLIKPSVHPYGEVRTYGIRLNTTNCGTAALRSVREFKVEGDVSGAALINTDPSGYGTLPTPWGLQLLYYNYSKPLLEQTKEHHQKRNYSINLLSKLLFPPNYFEKQS